MQNTGKEKVTVIAANYFTVSCMICVDGNFSADRPASPKV